MSAEATNISKLSIITEAKSGEAVKSLQSLASALSTLKDASKGNYNGLNKAADAIKNLMAQIHTISEADLGKLERLAAALSGIKGFKFSSGKTSFGGASSNSTAKGGKMSRYTPLAGGGGGGNGGNNNRGYGGSAWDAGGGSTGIDLGKIFADNGGGKGGWGKVASATLQKALGGISGFFKSIGRIAVYRLIRRGLQIISEGIKEGYQNALEWSRLNNTSLYPSMMKLKTAALVMKNQLGAAAGELLQTLQPALIQLAEVVTNIAEQFANMFAVMGGRGQYMRAKRNIDTLTEAQGKLNRTILAFDEINKLNGDNGYGNVSINDMFEMVDVNVKEANTLKATLTAIAAIVAGIRLTSFIMDLKDAIGWAGKLITSLGGGSAAGAGGAAAGAGAGAAGAGAGAGAAAGVLGAVITAAVVAAVAGGKKLKNNMDEAVERAAQAAGVPKDKVVDDIYDRDALYRQRGKWEGAYEYVMREADNYALRGELANVPPQNQTFPWAVGLPEGVSIPENQEITLTILDQSGAVLSSDPLSKYYADSVRVGSIIVGNGSVR